MGLLYVHDAWPNTHHGHTLSNIGNKTIHLKYELTKYSYLITLS